MTVQRPSACRRTAAIVMTAAAALLILGAQVGLGVSNVVFQLPLAVAVAHNGVAAILMMSLILLNVSLFWSGAKNHDKSYQQPKSTLSPV